jgi:hypothetical protein
MLLARYNFSGRIAGSYLRFEDGTALLTVRKGLPEPELKHVLARGLAQHCLGENGGIYLRRTALEEEDAAQEIAALLLLPPGIAFAGGLQDIHLAAEVFAVPSSLVRLRLRLEERLPPCRNRNGLTKNQDLSRYY